MKIERQLKKHSTMIPVVCTGIRQRPYNSAAMSKSDQFNAARFESVSYTTGYLLFEFRKLFCDTGVVRLQTVGLLQCIQSCIKVSQSMQSLNRQRKLPMKQLLQNVVARHNIVLILFVCSFQDFLNKHTYSPLLLNYKFSSTKTD